MSGVAIVAEYDNRNDTTSHAPIVVSRTCMKGQRNLSSGHQ